VSGKKVAAVLAAAGGGRRFGAAKQFSLLRGRPLLEWSLARFEAHPEVDEIVLVLPIPDEAQEKKYISRFHKVTATVKGGARRQDSVRNGFQALNPRKTGIVLIHDAARPMADAALISRVIEGARRAGAAVPAVPAEDTIKEAEGGTVVSTPDRSRLFRCQTPQGFSYSLLKQAFERADKERWSGNDESGFVERMGAEVILVDGDVRNFKITTAWDMKMAEVLLED
jgi:2-C-methyl-D-erythritol 4-phosphate cytidylyltransferase